MSVSVKIPYMPKTVDAEPLKRCIKFVANNMAVSDHFVAVSMSYFLEAIAAEVSKGQIIRIPGFGVFLPKRSTFRHKGEHYAFPCFSPSHGFRHEVKSACPLSKVQQKALNNYRSSNSVGSKAKKHTSRVFTSMKAFRTVMRAQARKLGIAAGPTGPGIIP